MKLFLSIIVIALLIVPSVGLTTNYQQEATLNGRWLMEFTLGGREYEVEFNAESSGDGTLKILNEAASLTRKPGAWKLTGQSSAIYLFLISGGIEFPKGNVGVEVGTIEFSASAERSLPITSLSGWGQYHPPGSTDDGRGGSNDPTFQFTAKRLPAVLDLQIVTPQAGQKIKRGKVLSIEWTLSGSAQLTAQSLWLSVDNRQTFVSLTPLLEGDIRSFLWLVPKTLSKTKKAFIKIIAIDDQGVQTEVSTTSSFVIK